MDTDITSGEIYDSVAIYVKEHRTSRFGEEYKDVFVTNKNNPKTRSTAQSWAGPQPTIIERENTPLTNLKILGIEYRDKGGTVFKCRDENNHVFDVRDESLLEFLNVGGCSPGANIQGKFVWGRIGSSNQLVNIESILYKELTELTRLKKIKAISKKEIKPFNVYRTRKGEVFINLGKVYLRKMKLTEESKKLNGLLHNHHSRNLAQQLNENKLVVEGQYSAFIRARTTIPIKSKPYEMTYKTDQIRLCYKVTGETKHSKSLEVMVSKLKNDLKPHNNHGWYLEDAMDNFSILDEKIVFCEHVGDISNLLSEEEIVDVIRSKAKISYENNLNRIYRLHSTTNETLFFNYNERLKSKVIDEIFHWLTISYQEELDKEAAIWHEIAKSREIYGEE